MLWIMRSPEKAFTSFDIIGLIQSEICNLTGKCPVLPQRDEQGQGAQCKMIFALPGSDGVLVPP